MSHSPETTAAETVRPQQGFLAKGLTRALTAAVLGAELTMIGLIVDAKSEAEALAAANVPVLVKGIQDVEVLLVNSSTGTEGTSDRFITESIRRADKAIRFSTAGAKGLGAVSIGTIHAKPAGLVVVEGIEKPCYTGYQVDNIFNHMFPDGRVPATDPSRQHMIVFNDVPACKLFDGAAAYATRRGAIPYTVYNLAVNGKNLDRVITHEYGHTQGLDHAPRIVCNRKGVHFYTDKSIQSQISDGCTTEKNDKGEVNVYASTQSVMGNAYEADMSGLSIPYSPVEMSKLNPDFKIETVEPVAGLHQIAVEPGKPIGVRLKLPQDHVLHNVVSGADSIVFALNDQHGWWDEPKNGEVPSVSDPRMGFEVNTFITSASSDDITTLDTADYKYLGSFAEYKAIFDGVDDDPVLTPPSPLYIDEQMGLAVHIGINKAGYFIQIKKLDTPTADTFLGPR